MASHPAHQNRLQSFNNVAFVLILLANIVVLLRDNSPPSGIGDAVIPSAIDTSAFDGSYQLVENESFLDQRRIIAINDCLIAQQLAARGLPDPKLLMQNAYSRSMLADAIESCADFVIRSGVIRAGRVLRWELSLTKASITDGKLVGTAIEHEDIHDPGDCQEVGVVLELEGERLKFGVSEVGTEPHEFVVLQRLPR